jgi:ABC-type transport system involved in cytochrome bd biosynthesis fused ATPase/permease subunit
MTGEVPKKRMSRGCLIALIVVGVLLLLVIIAGILWCLKGEQMIKNSTATQVTGFKTELNDNPVAGVDTVRVNAVADAFIEKLNESEVDYARYGRFVQALQALQSDEEIDSVRAEQFVQAMIEYFPELEELVPAVETEDSTYMEDTTSIE